MMIGDGINKTIITGNHSVVDGWTTFGSPTFGNFTSKNTPSVTYYKQKSLLLLEKD
jgi:hypothetical protein